MEKLSNIKISNDGKFQHKISFQKILGGKKTSRMVEFSIPLQETK